MLGTENGSGGGTDVLAESLSAETRLMKSLIGPRSKECREYWDRCRLQSVLALRCC
jgi:hypothetical protein